MLDSSASRTAPFSRVWVPAAAGEDRRDGVAPQRGNLGRHTLDEHDGDVVSGHAVAAKQVGQPKVTFEPGEVMATFLPLSHALR